MTERRQPETQAQPERQQSDAEICPQCGQPLYDCECTERWEDEGGAIYTPPD